MQKLRLNPEYARRHLFVTLLMLGLCGWFGYDGFVRYPATPAAELYAKIEGRAPDGKVTPAELEAFKHQKTQAQHGFTVLTLLAALVVGLRLLASVRFEFSFDDEGFTYRGKRRLYSEVKHIDRSQWKRKGIVKVDGIVLDSWHHLGVKDFLSHLETDLDNP